jgi:hypothetical protein
VLRHRQRREGHAEARPGGLVHLTEHHRGGVEQVQILQREPHVIALAGALPHPGEDRHALVNPRDVVQKLVHQNRLAHARAAEETDLPTLRAGAEQVEHLDTGLEQLRRHHLA